MIASMTGFGSAEGAVATTRVSIELRSVNHRYFSPSLKLPAEFARWEGEVREALRRRIPRGHITLTAKVDRQQDATPVVDEAVFAMYVVKLRELSDRHQLGGELDLATVLRMPDVIRQGGDEVAGTASELVLLVERAADALNEMRLAEGERLRTYLEVKLATLESELHSISERAPQRLAEQRDRWQRHVTELAGGVAVDPQRVAQELAIIAERLDIAEEISRFQSHLEAFHEALKAKGGESVGKRLGFLLQEMLRETNTTGSKANDAVILGHVVNIKEELERIREQVENIE
jgi:uncharacterized protein (TIGR00255 family)